VIIKLGLLKGKSLVFVSDIDRCYHLKLFLGQFGIRSCVLNSELPVNSRIHIVEEFNKNIYDIIIASDEHEVLGDEGEVAESSANRTGVEDADAEVEAPGETDQAGEEEKKATVDPKPAKKKRKVAKKDKEYGVSRGIDFKNVPNVLNFDLPTSSKSYIHRIGRTGRAGQSGRALSFVIPADQYRKSKRTSVESTKNDEKVLAKIIKHQGKLEKEVQPYQFEEKSLDAFRYRTETALRTVTAISVREARTAELRQELIKSEKLKRHFEENPADLHHLRHDGELRAAKVQPHLKHVPDYLMPDGGKKAIATDLGFIGIRKTSENGIRKRHQWNKSKGRGKSGGRKSDPLKTFKAKART
jgi:ATP-dependent RNA helicase DDX56/DBP9